jgi:hypothetical protein
MKEEMEKRRSGKRMKMKAEIRSDEEKIHGRRWR